MLIIFAMPQLLLLKALMKVSKTKDSSTLNETDAPKKKGKVCDVRTTEDPLNINIARKYRSKEVISRKLDSPMFPRNNLVPAAMLNSANFSRSLDFIFTPEHASMCYERMSNLE